MPKAKEKLNGQADYAFAEFVGYIKAKTEIFAASQHLLAHEVARGLAEILRADSDRALLGHSPRLRDLRSTGNRHTSTAGGDTTVAVAEPPPARSASTGQASVPGKVHPAKAYWDRMSPLQRRREFQRRKAKWSKDALARWSHKKRTKKVA